MSSLVVLDPRVADMPVSPTLAARIRSGQLAADGRRVYRLGLGQSPFPVPEPVIATLRASASEKDYLPPAGLPELRAAVADYHRRRHALSFAGEDVVIGPGSKELMFLLQLCFDGDVLVPTPSWVSYVPQARLAGRTIVRIRGGGRHGLMLDADDLRRACATSPGRPRLLFLNSPSNPTGLAFTSDELAAIAEVCRARGIVILSDEIYGELTFDGAHQSIASLYPEGTIVASGLSKWCGAGGWRLGTLALPATLRSLRKALEAVASETYSSTSAPIQHAAVAAFRPSGEIEDYLAGARRILSATMFWAAMRLSAAGLEVAAPAGGFYLLPGFEAMRPSLAQQGITDDRALVERLLTRTGIVAVSGSAFGLDPSTLRVRLSLVDFDGAHALQAATSQVIDQAFIRRNLAPVWAAIEALASWCDELKDGAS